MNFIVRYKIVDRPYLPSRNSRWLAKRYIISVKIMVCHAIEKEKEGAESMKMDFFDALQEVYTKGGIGNTLMCQFYENRIAGGSESQFAKLAVYMEWKYGITCTKQIKTEHIYELLELLKENGFKDITLKGYISAFRQVYKWNKLLFSESFEIPTNTGFAKWTEKRNT